MPTSLDRLRHDLKQVHVHTTAARVARGGSNPFTVYTLVVSCPTTKISWVIQKRYSHFDTLREKLVHTLVKARPTCISQLSALLRPFTSFAFPKKHLRLDTDPIIATRKIAFNAIATILMQVRSAMAVLALREPQDTDLIDALRELRAKLDAFLRVPDDQKANEKRRMAFSIFSANVQEAPHHASLANGDECAICLCDLGDDSASPLGILRLDCSHSFHGGCVVPWLKQNMTCPLCRKSAGNGVMYSAH